MGEQEQDKGASPPSDPLVAWEAFKKKHPEFDPDAPKKPKK